MQTKEEDLPSFITIQSLANALKVSIEQAQKFADLSITKGIIVPVGDGLYKCVSQAVMQRVSELCEAKKQQEKEELQRMWKDKLKGSEAYPYEYNTNNDLNKKENENER